MSQPCQATVCVVARGDFADSFRRCLASVLEHTPRERIELRLACSDAVYSFNHALGTLCPSGCWPQQQALPGGIERFHWTAKDGLRVWAWQSPRRLPREQLARLMFHDVALKSDYAICLDQSACVEAGWWDSLVPLMEKGIDIIGQPGWHDYVAGEVERLQGEPWYMGVPLARREGRAGVAFMRDGFVAARSERLREANFPPPRCNGRGDLLLGAIAQQLGWTQATYDQFVRMADSPRLCTAET